MKHPSVRELYHYWNAQRGLRAAPERSDIEPGAIRRALADTFILAHDAATGHSFRIAGTRLCAAFGRELRGTAFINLWDQESTRRINDLVGAVTRESVGAVAGARGCSADGEVLDFELVLLPLRHQTATDARVLGALAPQDLPYWFGMSPVGKLALGTIRYLGHEDMQHVDAAGPDQGQKPLPTGGRIFLGPEEVTAKRASERDIPHEHAPAVEAGISEAVEGNVLIYIHKEEELGDVEERYPARRYAGSCLASRPNYRHLAGRW